MKTSKLLSVLALSLLMGACTDKDGVTVKLPDVLQPDGAKLETKTAETPAPTPDKPSTSTGPVVTPDPVQANELVGTWDYEVIISQGTEYKASGVLILNQDLTFVDEVSINNGEVQKSKGTYSVAAGKVTVKTEGEEAAQTVAYEIGTADKNGVTTPALIIKGDNYTTILIKRQTEQPIPANEIVGTWDYEAVVMQGTQYVATGFVTLNQDLTFVEEVSVNGSEIQKNHGTYAVEGNKLSITTDGAEAVQVTYQIGEAEKNGVKKPSLIVTAAQSTSILVKRVQ